MRTNGSPRDLIDVYFSEPAVHLRIWRATLLPSPPIFTSRAENQPEFRALASKLAEHSPYSVRTASFSQWIKSDAVEIPVEFTSLVENDSYARWHLMAHRARMKLFPAVKS